MKIIHLLKVKLRKLRGNKVDEQRGRPGSICEGFRQVLAERDSLKDQLSDAKKTIADQSVSEKAKKAV
ncbi:hypothetical protein OIU84_001243 [Salix udensis]|uniref:Uncharacterized protein n=1 Tax=Salix udensis TaxID=889485 RepID=A0AAD6P5R0_9ROSI|nr:hypothetical protein OIU84_001243 [Salix udensis]